MTRYSSGNFALLPVTTTVNGVTIHVDENGKFWTKIGNYWEGSKNIAALKKKLLAQAAPVQAYQSSYGSTWHRLVEIVDVEKDGRFRLKNGSLEDQYSLYKVDEELLAEMDALEAEQDEFNKLYEVKVMALCARRVRFTKEEFAIQKERLTAEKETQDGDSTS